MFLDINAMILNLLDIINFMNNINATAGEQCSTEFSLEV